jgi:tetratricopeptide (TPR) repeat protein
VLRGLASLYLFMARLDKSAQLGEQILALGESEGDASMLIDGHLLVGTTLMSFRDLRGGLDHFDQAIAMFPPQPTATRTARVGNDPRVACLTTSAFTLWMLGLQDRAGERADAALALAAALNHPFTTAYARYHAGLLRLWRREPEAALTLATGLLDLADEHEFRIWTAAGTVLRGAARVGIGQADDGLADIRDGIGLYGELRSPPIFWPFLLYVQARAAADAARPAEGLPAVERSLAVLGGTSEASLLPELWIAKGDLLRSAPAEGEPRSEDAERWYRRALDHATEIGAGTARLRAATRLARLRVEDGDPVAASTILAPILGSFTEGFGTADVREARDVLEAVGTP